MHAGAALHVLHAEDPLLSAAAQHEGLDLSHETLEELRRFVDGTWPAPTCNPRLHAIAGQAADVILNTAHREHADVVVVGSHGMSGVERAVFGSTTEDVLRRADVSVLVVPEAWSAPRRDVPDFSGVGPVIAATDLSASASLAAAAAAWLAASLRTSLELVHVVPKRRVLGRWQSHANATMNEQLDTARQELATVVHALAATVPVTVRSKRAMCPNSLHRSRPPIRRGIRCWCWDAAPAEAAYGAGAVAYRVLTLARVPVLVYLGTT